MDLQALMQLVAAMGKGNGGINPGGMYGKPPMQKPPPMMDDILGGGLGNIQKPPGRGINPNGMYSEGRQRPMMALAQLLRGAR